jgi:hypothetical protein
MKATITRKAPGTLLKPLAMFSAPRLGPMVRSSMISMGAASEPARSSRASVGGLVDRVMRAGNLDPVAHLAADHRRGHDFALALFEQQDGHALADVLAADVAEDARSPWRPASGAPRLPGSGVKAGLGVGQVLAGQDDLLLDDDGWPLRSR